MIGNRIKKLRAEIPITQKELAEKIGVTTSMIGMYETNDRKPSYNILIKIANYFRVSTDYLLGNTKGLQEHIIADDELPDVFRPFLKKDSKMVVTLVESEDNEDYIQDSDTKKKALEKALKSMNAFDFPDFKKIINFLPIDIKELPISVYELLDTVGSDQNAMRKLSQDEQKDSIRVQPEEDNTRLLEERQMNAIASASQKLPPEKRELLQRLAESMIDEVDTSHK